MIYQDEREPSARSRNFEIGQTETSNPKSRNFKLDVTSQTAAGDAQFNLKFQISDLKFAFVQSSNFPTAGAAGAYSDI